MEQDPQEITRRKLEQLVDFKGRRVLEVGCGDGRLTAMIAGGDVDLTALDTDMEEVILARHRVPHCRFLVASGGGLPFPDAVFDLVLFSLSLHHQDGDRALREAARVTAPEGVVAVVEPSVDSEIQQCFHLSIDESVELDRASESIRTCALTVDGHASFHTDWIFQDMDELCRENFGYDRIVPDADYRARVRAMFAHRVADRPLVIRDRLDVYLLKKPST